VLPGSRLTQFPWDQRELGQGLRPAAWAELEDVSKYDLIVSCKNPHKPEKLRLVKLASSSHKPAVLKQTSKKREAIRTLIMSIIHEQNDPASRDAFEIHIEC
jgi:hypothetical protein